MGRVEEQYVAVVGLSNRWWWVLVDVGWSLSLIVRGRWILTDGKLVGD